MKVSQKKPQKFFPFFKKNKFPTSCKKHFPKPLFQILHRPSIITIKTIILVI